MKSPIIVMGVTGCGKTTIGTLLAERLSVPYFEGDDFHPAANVAKMRAGIPLTDDDRRPWLAALAGQIKAETAPPSVVSCSALTYNYRSGFRRANPHVWFLHLVLDEMTALRRVEARPGHFMPASLVASQFAALEPLSDDEAGLALDASRPPQDIVDTAVHHLAGQNLLAVTN